MVENIRIAIIKLYKLNKLLTLFNCLINKRAEKERRGMG